jgi:hypothetical protein
MQCTHTRVHTNRLVTGRSMLRGCARPAAAHLSHRDRGLAEALHAPRAGVVQGKEAVLAASSKQQAANRCSNVCVLLPLSIFFSSEWYILVNDGQCDTSS